MKIPLEETEIKSEIGLSFLKKDWITEENEYLEIGKQTMDLSGTYCAARLWQLT